MNIWSSRSAIGRWALCAAAGVTLTLAGANSVAAQEIEPNEFVPAPDGTNLAIGYYIYGHDTDFKFDGGAKVKDSGLEVNLGILRLVHYDYIFGMPAGVQVLEAFGSESAGHIDSSSLGSQFGASNPILSAFLWPIADTEKKQYLIGAIFLYPPVGTYDKNSGVNIASAFQGTYGWGGDAQVGWDQGIGEHFSYDASIDFRAFGDTTSPGGLRHSTDTEYRLQGWLNWNWTRAFQTSVGYEGFFGGTNTTNGFKDGTTANGKAQKIRVAASQFVLPNLQLLLEANHDVGYSGGFNQEFGITGRVVFIF